MQKKKTTSGGLILSLGEFGLMPYSNFFANSIYVVKNSSSESIIANDWIKCKLPKSRTKWTGLVCLAWPDQTRIKDCFFQNSPNNDFFLLTEAFSLFSVVTFPNDECTTVMDPTMRGLCITAEECTDQGGTASGNCASGFGVCCFTT